MLRLVVGLLFLLGWLSTNHFPPWVSWHSEVPFFAAAVLIAGAMLVRFYSMQRKIELPLILLLPAVLGVLAIVQWAQGQIVWHGQLIVILLYILLIVIGVQAGWNEGMAACNPASIGRYRTPVGEWLAWTILIGALASLVISLIQVFQVRETAPWMVTMPALRRPGANLGQANHLATLLTMGLGAVWYLSELQRYTRLTAWIMVCCLLMGIAITESRTGLLSVVCLCVWFSLVKMPGDRQTRQRYGIFLAALAIAMFIGWPSAYQHVMGEVRVPAEGVGRLAASGQDPRIVLWSQLFDASVLKPWLGWGIRNTAEAHNAVANVGNFSMPFTYSHNLILDLGVWLGWPIAMLMMGLSAYWLISRMTSTQTRLSCFAFFLVIPFAIHSLLEFPYAYAYFLLPMALAIGYIESANDSKRWKLSLPGIAALPVVIIFALIGALSVYDYVRAEDDFREMRFRMLQIGKNDATPAPGFVLLDQVDAVVNSSRINLTPHIGFDELQLVRLAALHNPWPATQSRYIAALAMTGQQAEANRQLRVLRAQHGGKVEANLRQHLNALLAVHELPPLE